MATKNCTYNGMANFNGGWTPSSGYNKTDDGYIGDGGGYGCVMQVDVPSAAGAAAGRSLTATIYLMTLYYSDITLEYWLTNAGRPDGPNYGSGPPAIKGTILSHGTVPVSGLNEASWTAKTFKTIDTGSLNVNGGTYYLWIRSNRNGVLRSSAATFVLNYTEQTKCSPPTAFSLTPSLFENEVKVEWSGAKSGISNPIKGYDFYYRDSEDGVSWPEWKYLLRIDTDKTYGSSTFTPGVKRGGYRQHKIYTLGTGAPEFHSAEKLGNTIKRNQVPKAPTSFTASPAIVASGDTVRLSWSGASDPDNNIAQYVIEKSVEGGEWIYVATVKTSSGSGSYTASVPEQAGKKVAYRIKAVDTLGAASGYKTGAQITVNTTPTAPTSFTADKSLVKSGGNVTFTWEGATDQENNIAGYRIEKSVNGGNWESAADVSSSSGRGTASLTVMETAGSVIRYRIKTYDTAEAQSGYASDIISLKVNTPPSEPGSLSVSSESYSAGDELTLSWNASVDPDGNLMGYTLQFAVAEGDVFGGWRNLATVGTVTEYVFTPDQAANGEKIKFRAAAYDSAGDTSPYAESSEVKRTDYSVAVGRGNQYERMRSCLGENGAWVDVSVCMGINGQWVKLFGKSSSQTGTTDEVLIGKEVSAQCAYTGVTIYGTLYATTETAAQPELTLWQNEDSRMTVKILKNLEGIKVSSGGNYTDSSGQMWLCDEYDLAARQLTKRVESGQALPDPAVYQMEDLGYPPQPITYSGTLRMQTSVGELKAIMKKAVNE